MTTTEKIPYTAILCLTDNDGMSLMGKRVSSDRILRQEMLSHVENRLHVTEYSSRQFTEEEQERLSIDNVLPEEGYVFMEIGPVSISEADKIIIYRWNRKYLVNASASISYENYKKVSARDFAGSSHENITEEIWTRK